jgi:hypothetical protein
MKNQFIAFFIISLLIVLFPLSISEKSIPEYIAFASIGISILGEFSKNSSPPRNNKKRERLKKE